MSAAELKQKDTDDLTNSILAKLQTVKGEIVDAEILIKSKYSTDTEAKVKDNIERLKQNIFDLDISISNRLVE